MASSLVVSVAIEDQSLDHTVVRFLHDLAKESTLMSHDNRTEISGTSYS